MDAVKWRVSLLIIVGTSLSCCRAQSGVPAQDALPRSAEILLHPEDSVQVEAGMGVTLTCVVYGSPLPEVTWTREGERIENSSDAAMYQTYLEHLNNTLVQSLLELCPALAGNYGCSATNTHGDDTVSFQVAVQREDTVIFDYPEDIVADISESSVSFNCSASGVPLPDISWFKDGSLLDPNTNNITHTTTDASISSVLEISPLLLSDDGVYICNASGYDDTAAREFTFTLESPAAIFLYPNDTTTSAGDSLSLTCTASGIPLPLITWSRDGVALTSDLYDISETSISSPSLYFAVSILTLCDLQAGASTYNCTTSNTVIQGSVTDSRSFSLEVEAPPTISASGDVPFIGVETRDGPFAQTTVGFSISAYPPVLQEDISWSYTNASGDSSQVDIAMNSSKYELSSDMLSLTIFNLSLSDAGFFTLSAANEIGMRNGTLSLAIHVEPVLFLEKYSGNRSVEGRTSTFSCAADGIPPPNIVWLHNNSFIVTSRKDVRISSVMSNRSHVPMGVNSTLTLRSLQPRDSGEYACRVDPYNIDRGTSVFSLNFNLTVDPAPINYCENEPCLNGGTCSNVTEGYLCMCDTNNWRGVNCETMVLEFIPVSIKMDPELEAFPDLLERVNLTCDAVGVPNPEIMWYKDGEEIPGEFSRYLVFSEVEVGHRGRYHCTASNSDPNASQPEINTNAVTSENALVNINGIAQYRATVDVGSDDSESERRLQNLFASLSGVQLDDNATIISATSRSTDNASALVVITVLTPQGGSQLLTEALNRRFNTSVAEQQLVLSQAATRFDGCLANSTVFPPLEPGGLSVTIQWPESDIGEEVSLQCPCGNLSAISENAIGRNATRVCGGDFTVNGGQWKPAMADLCNFSITIRRLCEVVNVLNEPDEAIDQLENLTRNESNIESVAISVTTSLLQTLQDNMVMEPDRNRSEGLLVVVDNLLDADPDQILMSQQETNTSARILTLVEEVGQTVPFPEDTTELIIPLTAFALAVMRVDQNSFMGQEFSVNLGSDFVFSSDEMIDAAALSFTNTTRSTASLSIPENILNLVDIEMFSAANVSLEPRITNSVFLSDLLFSRRGNVSNSTVGSIIVATTLSLLDSSGNSRDVRVVDLNPPLLLVFLKKPGSNDTMPSCNFWNPAADEGFGDWSTLNCRVKEENETTVVCECTHFTNFAIILDPNPVPIPVRELEVALTAVSYIGVIISIICLLLTILTYLSSKKLRSSEPGQMLLNLSFGLLGLFVLFIVCLHATRPEILCAVAGGLLHYFMLVSFFLMAAEAINLYVKLVIVLGIPAVFQNRYVLKAALIAWIVPLLIVAASEAPEWRNYTGNFCRPYGKPFWGALVVPFGLIYIFNWIVFILIFASLLRKKQKNPSAGSKIRQHFIIALTLSLLFGLGWGVGLVATSSIPSLPVSATLQAIFILFTGFQGLFIFIMHCVRSEDARKEWAKWASVVICCYRSKATKFGSHVVSSGELTYNYRRKAGSTPYGGTLSTSVNPDSDTLKKVLDSPIITNESVFIGQEEEKVDLSLMAN